MLGIGPAGPDGCTRERRRVVLQRGAEPGSLCRREPQRERVDLLMLTAIALIGGGAVARLRVVSENQTPDVVGNDGTEDLAFASLHRCRNFRNMVVHHVSDSAHPSFSRDS